MKNLPVTILMPVYNGERYLAESIGSILGQTWEDFEFLIINDGSTDNSKEIICSYDDHRIRLVDNPCNLGLAKTLNMGIKMACGEYIARQDCDDISLPNRIEHQLSYLRSYPETVLLGSFGQCVDQSGNRLRKLCPQSNSSLLKWRLLFYNNFIHSSVIFNKEKIRHLGGYDTEIGLAQDYSLWTKILFRHEISQLPEVLVLYRKHKENLSSKHFTLQESNVELIVKKNIDYLLCTNVSLQAIKDLRLVINSGTLMNFVRFKKTINMFEEIFSKVIELWTPSYAKADLISKDYAMFLKNIAIKHLGIHSKESRSILKRAIRLNPFLLLDTSVLIDLLKSPINYIRM